MHSLFKSIVDDFAALPAKVATAQAKESEVNVSNANEPAMSDEVVMANIETITGLLSRSDITAYASSALQRLLTSLTLDMDRRAKERPSQPDYRQALTDLVALVESIHDATEGRWPAVDINCAVCTQGCAPASGVCAWHSAKRMLAGKS